MYNMQLSNEPAEELAQFLVGTGNNAFELCGFVSGGKSIIDLLCRSLIRRHPGSEAMEAVIKLGRQVRFHPSLNHKLAVLTARTVLLGD